MLNKTDRELIEFGIAQGATYIMKYVQIHGNALTDDIKTLDDVGFAQCAVFHTKLASDKLWGRIKGEGGEEWMQKVIEDLAKFEPVYQTYKHKEEERQASPKEENSRGYN